MALYRTPAAAPLSPVSFQALGRSDMRDNWTVRRAVESDREFLFRLYALTMRSVVEQTWGWDEEWQRTDFAKRFLSAPFYIIESSSQPIGALCLEQRPDCLYIRELQLLPERQGHGVGTAIIQMVIAEAREQRLPVNLSVVSANDRAQRLYERLGFRVAAVEPPFIRMVHGSAGMRERPN